MRSVGRVEPVVFAESTENPDRFAVFAPKGQLSFSPGRCPGKLAEWSSALKGRFNALVIEAPFQGWTTGCRTTQGVALG